MSGTEWVEFGRGATGHELWERIVSDQRAGLLPRSGLADVEKRSLGDSGRGSYQRTALSLTGEPLTYADIYRMGMMQVGRAGQEFTADDLKRIAEAR